MGAKQLSFFNFSMSMFGDNTAIKNCGLLWWWLTVVLCSNMTCKKDAWCAKVVELLPFTGEKTCSNILALVVSAHVKLQSALQFDSVYINFSSSQLQVSHSIWSYENLCIYIFKILLKERFCFKRLLPLPVLLLYKQLSFSRNVTLLLEGRNNAIL